jgi:3-hydroxy-9,10-secoandrosta-1,3,5(10)-triene-9,17-dione monooxygenase reductase component
MNPAAAPTRAIERERFRQGLSQWATGVGFVTASVGGLPEGLVVNSLTSVSLEPPLIAFCPSRISLTWCRMRAAERFGVNVLDAGTLDFVRRAAGPGTDRFDGVSWTPTASGVPALSRALAFFECAIEEVHAAGDHWIVVGRVEDMVTTEDGAPLVFWNGGYRSLAPG